MKISVIVPIYNAEEQTPKNRENLRPVPPFREYLTAGFFTSNNIMENI